MYCVVLDFEGGAVKVFEYDEAEDVEVILTEGFGFSLNAVQWMCVPELSVQFVAVPVQKKE